MAETKATTSTEPGKRIFVNSLAAEDVTGQKPPTSYLASLTHLVKGYVGTGIFALGLAFKNSGIVFGPILLILIAYLNLHSQHLLVQASIRIAQKETEEVKPTFPETVKYTFQDSSGWIKRYARFLGNLTNVFICIAELGMCCVYFVFVAQHFKEVAQAYGWKGANDFILLAIVLLPMWLSTFLGSLKYLMPVAFFANILMWVGVVIIIYFTVQGLGPIGDRKLIAGIEKQPLFFGVVLFAFEGITFVIQLRNEMRNPKRFTTTFGVLNVGIVIVVVIYIAVGVLAYWKYGDDIKGSVFLNLPQTGHLPQVTKILMAIAVLFTFTLHFYIPIEIAYPEFYLKCGPFKHPYLMLVGFRTVLVLITYGLANAIPHLGLFISLVGALTGAVLALILPPMLEIAALGKEIGKFVLAKDILIIIIGVLGALAGTVLSLVDIVYTFVYPKKE